MTGMKKKKHLIHKEKEKESENLMYCYGEMIDEGEERK